MFIDLSREKMYGKFSKFHALNSCCSTKQYSMYPGCQRFFSQWGNLAAKLQRRVVTSTATSTTRSDAPRCWRARRPLASRVVKLTSFKTKLKIVQPEPSAGNTTPFRTSLQDNLVLSTGFSDNVNWPP